MHIFGGSYTLTPQWQNALQNGDMLLTCDGTATTVTCMAQTQPSGTTYQWSLTANGNEVSLSNTTSNSTTVSPVSASSSMGEIVLRLTYSLLGYTAQSNQTLTVHEPARPPSSRTTSAVQTWQGIACQYPQSDPFSSDIIKYGNQHIQVCWMTNLYTVKSKAGMLLPGILWHETNTVQCIQGDGYTDSNGQILDCLQYPVIPNFPGGSDTSSNIRYTNIHKIWLSGCGPLWNSTETVYNTPDIVQVLNN